MTNIYSFCLSATTLFIVTLMMNATVQCNCPCISPQWFSKSTDSHVSAPQLLPFWVESCMSLLSDQGIHRLLSSLPSLCISQGAYTDLFAVSSETDKSDCYDINNHTVLSKQAYFILKVKALQRKYFKNRRTLHGCL